MRAGERSPPLHFLARTKEVSHRGFRPNTQGPIIVEFAFIRSLWSGGDIECEKKKEEWTQVAVRRCGVCAWWWCRPTFPKSHREWKKDRRFERVWCTWDPAVRTSGAVAFAAQVSDTKELVSQDHSAPPTPPRIMWKPTYAFQMMVRVGRRMTEPLPVVMAGKRTAQTDGEGNVNRQTPQQGT